MYIKPAGNASDAAITGLQRGQRALTRAASDVANGDLGEGARQTTQGLVDAQLAAQQIEASAKALQRSDSALGSLIDTLA